MSKVCKRCRRERELSDYDTFYSGKPRAQCRFCLTKDNHTSRADEAKGHLSPLDVAAQTNLHQAPLSPISPPPLSPVNARAPSPPPHAPASAPLHSQYPPQLLEPPVFVVPVIPAFRVF